MRDVVIRTAAAGAIAVAVAVLGGYIGARTAPATRPAGPTAQQLTASMEKLRPLYKKLGERRPGDWLYHHKEPGQTFEQYRRCKPTLPRGKRRVIHIQPLGQFTDPQRKIVTLVAEFMGRFYNLPAHVQKDLPMSLIPPDARRVHPSWGDRQILTGYVLDRVLKPRLPSDAAVYLAFAGSDLWPGRGWNFVFGQASLRDRVGVWSIYRYGDPGKDAPSSRRCLLRTLKTAVHETGHMFSMLHCTAYECGMCGSNSLAESDRRPLAFCPECMAKVCWATGADPVERYRKLAEFCKTEGLKAEAEFYGKCLKALTGSSEVAAKGPPKRTGGPGS